LSAEGSDFFRCVWQIQDSATSHEKSNLNINLLQRKPGNPSLCRLDVGLLLLPLKWTKFHNKLFDFRGAGRKDPHLLPPSPCWELADDDQKQSLRWSLVTTAPDTVMFKQYLGGEIFSQLTVRSWFQELSEASPFPNSQYAGPLLQCFASRL